MSTKAVARLEEAVPNRHLVCWVDFERPEAICLYLGEDRGDHTTRIGFYRVTRDGEVWVDLDETGLEDRWQRIW